MKSILIVGGDKRQIALQKQLEQRGWDVSMAGFDRLGIQSGMLLSPDYVFLPVPYKDGHGNIKAPFADTPLLLKDIVAKYPRSVYVLGRCDKDAIDVLGSAIRYIDLLCDDAFLVKNAQLTAQAAVCVYAQHTDTALCDTQCVVIGYGRIAKFLCALLCALGADVTATARKERDFMLIRAQRMRTEHTDNVGDVLANADVIWNTVPSHVLGTEELSCIRRDALVIELASAPYGMEMEQAQTMGVGVHIESGLPGRIFPDSAALAILDAFERKEHNRWS